MIIPDLGDIPDGERRFVLDHPLAGKDIIFDIILLDILSGE